MHVRQKIACLSVAHKIRAFSIVLTGLRGFLAPLSVNVAPFFNSSAPVMGIISVSSDSGAVRPFVSPFCFGIGVAYYVLCGNCMTAINAECIAVATAAAEI